MRKYDGIIINLLKDSDGLDDDEISKELSISPRQTVNATCRQLEKDGIIERRKCHASKKLKNYYKQRPSENITEAPSSIVPKILRLEEVGFLYAGHWEIKDDSISPTLNKIGDNIDVLYAFVVGEEVKYVGKTSQKLKKRMSGYKSPGKAQVTNIRNNECIKEVLKRDASVEIHVLSNQDHDEDYKGFKVSLAAGLEDSIIKELQPEWNKRK